MSLRRQLWTLMAAALVLVLSATGARAEDETAPKAAPEPGTVNLIEELNKALESRDRVILELLRRVEALENEKRADSVEALEDEKRADSPAQPEVVQDKTLPPGEADAEPARRGADDELDEADKLAQSALERTLIESGSMLLPAGTVEIQPSLAYALASADTITIDCLLIEDILCIGDIGSQKIRRDSFFSDWIFRLGLPWDLQLDARVPFGYETRRVVFADGSSDKADVFDVGDVELSLSSHFLRGRGWIPDVLGAFRWKSTSGGDPFSLDEGSMATGTGFNDLQLSLTAVKVRDPVVLFSNFNYTFRLPDTKPDIGKVDLGDIFGLQLGLAVALNLETSLSFGWNQRWVQDARVDGSKVRGVFERPGSLRIGGTYVPAAGRSIDFGVSVGITEDAPDVEARLAFPLRLPYRIPFPDWGQKEN